MAARVFIAARSLVAVVAVALGALIALGPSIAVASPAEPSPPTPTINEFFPEERALGDCLNNSIPLPNCGSSARGGWGQTIVLVAIVAGLAFIVWRIVAASRRARLSRTPAATTAPDGDGGAPAP